MPDGELLQHKQNAMQASLIVRWQKTSASRLTLTLDRGAGRCFTLNRDGATLLPELSTNQGGLWRAQR